MERKPLFWLECVESDVPTGESWLSDAETACFRTTWVQKRRCDWLLGRWTAKCALATHLGLALESQALRAVSIVPAETGAPVVLLNGEPLKVGISISHRGGRALAVVSPQAYPTGCDLEKCEPRSKAFIDQFFTPLEVDQVEHFSSCDCTNIAALTWSAKESVLKALAVGLRVDTRCVSVTIGDVQASTNWHAYSALAVGSRSFFGWWKCDGAWIRTLASSTPTPMPLALPQDHSLSALSLAPGTWL